MRTLRLKSEKIDKDYPSIKWGYIESIYDNVTREREYILYPSVIPTIFESLTEQELRKQGIDISNYEIIEVEIIEK